MKYYSAMIKNNICDNIVSLLKQNNMNAIELAKRLNISAQSVSRYVNHESIPNFDIMIAICEIFNVSIIDLMGLREYEAVDNNTEHYLREDAAVYNKTKKAPTEEELEFLEAIRKNPDLIEKFKKAFMDK